MSVCVVCRDNTISIVLPKFGKVAQVKKGDINYGKIREAIKKQYSEDKFLELLDTSKMVEKTYKKILKGAEVLVDGTVLWNGKPLHNTIATRISQFMKEGLPYEHLIKFINNVNKNENPESREELYDFLEHRNLPITDDGCFLAYKAVTKDWKDKHTKTINNSIGQIVKMPRELVNPNRDIACGVGLHCGALDYVYSFAGGDDRIVIVKVNPRDAVSVPDCSSYQKLRCCRYEVVSEFVGELVGRVYDKNVVSIYDGLDEQENWEDCYDAKDVTSTKVKKIGDMTITLNLDKSAKVFQEKYGRKPDGRKYYNVRKGGKFAKIEKT